MTPEELLSEFRAHFRTLSETFVTDIARVKDDVGRLYDKFNAMNLALGEMSAKLQLAEQAHSSTAAMLRKDLDHFREMMDAEVEGIVADKCRSAVDRIPRIEDEILKLTNKIDGIKIPADPTKEIESKVDAKLREFEARQQREVQDTKHDYERRYDEAKKRADDQDRKFTDHEKSFNDLKIQFTEARVKIALLVGVGAVVGSGLASVLIKLVFK